MSPTPQLLHSQAIINERKEAIQKRSAALQQPNPSPEALQKAYRAQQRFIEEEAAKILEGDRRFSLPPDPSKTHRWLIKVGSRDMWFMDPTQTTNYATGFPSQNPLYYINHFLYHSQHLLNHVFKSRIDFTILDTQATDGMIHEISVVKAQPFGHRLGTVPVDLVGVDSPEKLGRAIRLAWANEQDKEGTEEVLAANQDFFLPQKMKDTVQDKQKEALGRFIQEATEAGHGPDAQEVEALLNKWKQ